MEANGLSGEMFSSMSSGMLGLEMSLHPHQQPPPPPPQQQNPRHLQQQHPHPQMVAAYGHHHEADHHHNHHPQTLQSMKQGYPYATKAKPQQLTLSDEDEPGLTAEDSAGDGKKKISPWQRMKWTDSMVRLLIMVVFYIGDEAGSEGSDHAGKKKGGGVLQKKGKWKSVSRAMMERGFYVSPQQCEDKFNDLNKRYKRVNDILGKGTACRVVENQSLLETMDHLSPKMKEEVKKLLNSKHLFFREMCAYHNSCGGGGGGGGTSGAHHSPEVAAEPSQIQQQSQQQSCFHSSESAPIGANSGRAELEGLKMVKGGSGEEEEEDDDEDDDDDDDENEDEVVEGDGRVHEHGHEEDDDDEKTSRKRPRKGGAFSSSLSSSPLIQQLSGELMSVVQDGTKSSWEKRQWMKKQLIQLEEQGVSYQCNAFELEKQRLKWVKFSSKKEREMEREKLKNQRMRLENERMVLLLRQKEFELLDLQQQQQQQQQQKE
uniref:Putative stress response protein NST1 n=1 Tax=Davidia involucrata TaxID=16924 RepID=A0A5B7BZJ5_DAVIN